jgi:hypothetical protein
MNIFYLSNNTKLCARYHCDKHQKMILESAQILSTCHHLFDSSIKNEVYKSTHKNHPCVKWAADNKSNYRWLHSLFEELAIEFNYRRDRFHKSWMDLGEILRNPPDKMPDGCFFEPPQAMPWEYKHVSTTAAYRGYYIGEKAGFAKWTKRKPPAWFVVEKSES